MTLILFLGNSVECQISANEHQTIFLSTDGFFELSGQVTKNNFRLDSAVIYLYREQIQGAVELVDSIHSYGNMGKFSFDKMILGTYYIRARMINPDPFIIDTYYGESAYWIKSKAIILRNDVKSRVINLQKESKLNGLANISGKVEYGAGEINFPLGQGAIKIPVLVIQNGTVIRRTQTDKNGIYSFTDLPIMNCELIVDYPGKSMANYNVVLNSGNKQIQNLDFIIEKSTIEERSVNTGIESKREKETSVFPNPCTSRLNILFSNGKTNYSIIDCTGKSRLNGIEEHLESIDVSELERGIYFLILNDNKTRKVIRITKT